MFHNTPLQKYGHNVEIASNFYDYKMEIRPDDNLESNTSSPKNTRYQSGALQIAPQINDSNNYK